MGSALARRLLTGLLFIPALCRGDAMAGECRPDEAKSHEACVARVQAAGEREFARLLETYARHLAAHPDDAVAAAERCRFIERAFFDEIEELSAHQADFETCLEDLRTRLPDAPAVKQLELEQTYGEDAAELADQLLALDPSPFSRQQRADILQLAAERVQYDDEVRAGAFARRALELDPGLPLAPIAAAPMVESEPESAADLLLRWLDRTSDPVPRARAAALLVAAGRPREAIRVFDALEAEGAYFDRRSLARALAAVGELARARETFTQLAHDQRWAAEEIALERFEMELERGSPETAAASYAALRDQGFQADPLLRRRADLWLRFPGQGIEARDLLGLAALLGWLGVGFGLGALLLVPIHYFGLLRGRTERLDFAQQRRFGLLHLWLAMGLIFALESGVTWAVHYDGVAPLFADSAVGEVDVGGWSRVALWSAPLGLLAVLALLRPADREVWLRPSWSPRRSIAIGAAASVPVLVVGMLNAAALSLLGVAMGSLTSHDILLGLAREHGLGAFVLLAIVIAPLTEEILFREIGLRALSRYLDFGAANLLQACAFAALHQDPSRFVPLFAVGWLAGTLRRSSGGLLAPLALHVANNAIAVLAIAARL